jgi:16S rRNA (guanine527-N7)-methyltransferase
VGNTVERQAGNIGELLRKGCLTLELEVAEDTFDLLERYCQELLHWSRKINLVGKKQSPQLLIENHFLDSLVLLPYLKNEGCILVDVGSGAGFPGLVCKTALPDLQLKLVEPRLKRVSFLRHIIRSLGLEKVEVFADRLENIAPESLSSTNITSRAVAEIEQFAEMVDPYVDDETQILCMKGPKWKEEFDRASPTLERLRLVLAGVDELSLPFSQAERAVLTFRRISAL